MSWGPEFSRDVGSVRVWWGPGKRRTTMRLMFFLFTLLLFSMFHFFSIFSFLIFSYSFLVERFFNMFQAFHVSTHRGCARENSHVIDLRRNVVPATEWPLAHSSELMYFVDSDPKLLFGHFLGVLITMGWIHTFQCWQYQVGKPVFLIVHIIQGPLNEMWIPTTSETRQKRLKICQSDPKRLWNGRKNRWKGRHMLSIKYIIFLSKKRPNGDILDLISCLHLQITRRSSMRAKAPWGEMVLKWWRSWLNWKRPG